MKDYHRFDYIFVYNVIDKIYEYMNTKNGETFKI